MKMGPMARNGSLEYRELGIVRDLKWVAVRVLGASIGANCMKFRDESDGHSPGAQNQNQNCSKPFFYISEPRK